MRGMPGPRTRYPMITRSAQPLPPAALSALHAGDKATAIRIVQDADGVSAEEAERSVDALLELKPMLKSACEGAVDARGRGLGRVLVFILLAGAFVIGILLTRP